MHKPCLALVATTVTGGAFLAALFTAPAWADPTTPQCFQAQANVASQQNNVQAASTNLSNDTLKLQNDQNDLTLAQATIPVDPTIIGNLQTKVSGDQKQVNSDQASLATAQRNYNAAVATRDAACASTPTTTPAPTTTPVPPPVGGTVSYPTCAAAFRAGAHDILRADPRYRIYLDRDRDGIACELNGQDNPPPPAIIVRPTPTTIQAPATVVPGPVIQGPATVVPGPVFDSPIAPSRPTPSGDGSLAYLTQ